MADAHWRATLWTAAGWRSWDGRSTAGFFDLPHWPCWSLCLGYMHVKYLGSDQRQFASILYLLCFQILTGQPNANLANLWAQIKEIYSTANCWPIHIFLKNLHVPWGIWWLQTERKSCWNQICCKGVENSMGKVYEQTTCSTSNALHPLEAELSDGIPHGGKQLTWCLPSWICAAFFTMLPANRTLAVQKMCLAFSLLLQSYIALCTSVPWCFPGEDLLHVL